MPKSADKPSNGKTPESILREKRLAEALRVNLRRRKAQARGRGMPAAQNLSGDKAPGRGGTDG